MLALAVLLAGCSRPILGSPDTYPPGPELSGDLEAGKFTSDLCSLLGTQQQRQLGIGEDSEGLDTSTDVGEGRIDTCAWFPESGDIAHLGFLSGTSLADLHQEKDEYELFEPTWVHGRSAVVYDNHDMREYGYCGLAVGLSDSTSLYVKNSSYENEAASCDTAKKFATAALRTIESNS